MSTRSNRSNQTIECLRFVCSVAILFIHCGFPLAFASEYAMAVSRFAVPYLILLSGWYVDHNGKVEKAKKKRRDILRIILAGGCVCVIWNCFNSYLQYGNLSSWTVPYLNNRTLIDFLLFNRAVFLNSVYYYFFMMFYVYSIFIGAQRLRFSKMLLILSPVLLFGGVAICEFSSMPWYYGGNFLFVGIPCFCTGYLLRKAQDHLRILKSKEWAAVAVGLLLTYLEYRGQGSCYLYFGTIVVAVSVLVFCMNHEDIKCPKLLIKAGTYLSLPIIVIHCEIRDTLQILFPNLGINKLSLLVLFLSVISAMGYQIIKKVYVNHLSMETSYLRK